MKTYWFNIKYACGAVTVDKKGYIVSKGTAPIFQWAAKQKMAYYAFQKFYKTKRVYIDSKEI